MQYRREIDGLRAVAVLPVILFHAGFNLLRGGFVGVDIFFVISGYLITTILSQEHEAGRFTLAQFYERRARRILPALFVVLLACLPLAWHWLMPADLQSFSRSLIAVCLFASNILFWRTSGYFDSDSALSPLLHTWSLAVEEQYYVFFPLFLMLAWRLGRRWLVALLLLAGVLSLGAAQWGATHRPAATFYLLPTRAWELVVGALCAFALARRPLRPKAPPTPAQQAGAALGLGLIATAVFAFNEHLPFPSVYALVPTLGTALIVLCATPATHAGRLLGSKPLVGIGLISYSAYLWHQPLFAFARYQSEQAPSLVLMGALALLALALAWLTWKYVETPARNKQALPRTLVVLGGLTGSLLFITLGTAGELTKGFEGRLSAAQRQVAAYSHYADKNDVLLHTCFLDPDEGPQDYEPTCAHPTKAVQGQAQGLIWGDSYAAALGLGLRHQAPGRWVQYTASACPPFFDQDVPERPHCRAVNDFVLQHIARTHPAELVLDAEWHFYRAPLRLADLAHTLARVKAVSPGTRVTVVGSVPQWPPTLPIYAVRKHVTLTQETYLPMGKGEQLQRVDAELKALARQQGARFLSPLDALCVDQGTRCLAVVRHGQGHALAAWDNGHLTVAGSQDLVARLFGATPRP